MRVWRCRIHRTRLANGRSPTASRGWYPRPDSNRCYRLERGIQGPTDRLRMSGRRVDTSTTVRPWLRTRLRTRPLPELLLAKRVWSGLVDGVVMASKHHVAPCPDGKLLSRGHNELQLPRPPECAPRDCHRGVLDPARHLSVVGGDLGRGDSRHDCHRSRRCSNGARSAHLTVMPQPRSCR